GSMARRAGARRQRAAAGRPRPLAAGVHRRALPAGSEEGAAPAAVVRDAVGAQVMAGDGFLSRWGRRKAEARSGVPASDAAPVPSGAEGGHETPLPTLP